eukprot:11143532-Heterocapsa_arctica.AAC.1
MEQPLAVTIGTQRCAIVPPSTRVLCGTCTHEAWWLSTGPKSGALRLVVDAREANKRLLRPPSTRLASTAAVVEFECPPDEEL